MMTRVLLLADIHANHAALLAAMADASRRYAALGRLRLWFLGDLFGRGPDAVLVWNWLNDRAPEVVVAGNHDWGVFGLLTTINTLDGRREGQFGRDDHWVIEQHRLDLMNAGLLVAGQSGLALAGGPGDEREFGRWPLVRMPAAGVWALHGGADRAFDWDRREWEIDSDLFAHLWGYVKEPQDVNSTFQVLDGLAANPELLPTLGEYGMPARPVLAIVGHLHKRRFAVLTSGGVTCELPVRLDSAYALDVSATRRILVSPGSVGFPDQELDLAACYAVLTLDDDRPVSICFHAAPYDVAITRERMRSRAYPESIVRRLSPRGGRAQSLSFPGKS